MLVKTTLRFYIFIAFLSLALCEKTNAQSPVSKPSATVEPGVITAIPGSRCGAGRVKLHASSQNPGDTIKWYNRPTGSSPLGKGENWTTPVISSTTTYYVSASKRGHPSARTPVKATINAFPATPEISPKATASFCEGGSVKLSAITTSPDIEWSTGATTADITVTAAGNYSARVCNASGCSATSSVTAVRVKRNPHIVSITPGLRCGHGQLPLEAKADAGMVNWYDSKASTVSISKGTLYFTPTGITPGTTIYYVDATERGCVSPRIAIPATIKPVPSITSTTRASRNDAGPLFLKAKSNAGVINWYAQAIGGISLATDTVFTTPSLSATTVYFAEASLDGCSSARDTVLAIVGNSSLSSTNIDNNQKPSISIYPNPNKGVFKITSSADMIYIVTNESKNTVAEGRFNSSNNHTLELKDFANGVYYFIGYNKGTLVKQKIIVS